VILKWVELEWQRGIRNHVERRFFFFWSVYVGKRGEQHKQESFWAIEWREGTNDSIMLIVLLMSWIARGEERRRQWNRFFLGRIFLFFFFVVGSVRGASHTLIFSCLLVVSSFILPLAILSL
jgi:hypothetical protein